MAAVIPAQVAVEPDEVQYVKVTFWRRFRRHRLAVGGIVVLLIMVLCAVFAPEIAHYNPNFIDEAHWNGPALPPCFEGAANIGGQILHCAGHILGTDEVGRDEFSRLLFGARISMTLAVTAVLMEVTIGTLLGALAGYYGGIIDYLLMRVTDVFLSIPILPLLLVLTGIVAASSTKAALNFGTIVLIIGALSWPTVARLVRANFLTLREREYAEAARAIGNGDARIIFRHLLPNTVAPIVVQATLDVANVIILESTLDFLGFGIQPPTASWGNMLSNATANIEQAWWAAVFPGLCIFITTLAINFIGDGLRDALDPNMK
jgi:peptide/nickel transport system permease protein